MIIQVKGKSYVNREILSLNGEQGINKEGEMALVWHKKASRTVLQTSSLFHTHTVLVQTHNMTTVKEIAKQCCHL